MKIVDKNHFYYAVKILLGYINSNAPSVNYDLTIHESTRNYSGKVHGSDKGDGFAALINGSISYNFSKSFAIKTFIEYLIGFPNFIEEASYSGDLELLEIYVIDPHHKETLTSFNTGLGLTFSF